MATSLYLSSRCIFNPKLLRMSRYALAVQPRMLQEQRGCTIHTLDNLSSFRRQAWLFIFKILQHHPSVAMLVQTFTYEIRSNDASTHSSTENKYLLSSATMGSLTLGMFPITLTCRMPEPFTPNNGICVTDTLLAGVEPETLQKKSCSLSGLLRVKGFS